MLRRVQAPARIWTICGVGVMVTEDVRKLREREAGYKERLGVLNLEKTEVEDLELRVSEHE
jgi:tartrate dehydratase beta subunit/fumarate hydratase class I family protein